MTDSPIGDVQMWLSSPRVPQDQLSEQSLGNKIHMRQHYSFGWSRRAAGIQQANGGIFQCLNIRDSIPF